MNSAVVDEADPMRSFGESAHRAGRRATGQPGAAGQPGPRRRWAGNRRSRVLVTGAVLVSVAAMVGVPYVTRSILFSDGVSAPTIELYVSPEGDDTSDGRTVSRPVRTVQAALNLATPGTRINVADGVYQESVHTVRAGSKRAPIILRGHETGKARSGRYKAVVYGDNTILSINHSHYVVEGFTIDGQRRLSGAAFPKTLDDVAKFKDDVQSLVVSSRLVGIGGKTDSAGVSDVTIRNMYLHGAGGECVRLRNGAKRNVIEDSVIEWCGLRRAPGSDTYPYHNGEGVYIGTSPKSETDSARSSDASSANVVRDNTIHTYGAECFDVKENAHDNVFEGNDCRYNDEPLSFGGSNVEIRGHHNIVVHNQILGSRGWNVKFKSDSSQFDRGGNSLRNNVFGSAEGPNLYVSQRAVGDVCGNKFKPGAPTRVDGRLRVDPTARCRRG